MQGLVVLFSCNELVEGQAECLGAAIFSVTRAVTVVGYLPTPQSSLPLWPHPGQDNESASQLWPHLPEGTVLSLLARGHGAQLWTERVSGVTLIAQRCSRGFSHLSDEQQHQAEPGRKVGVSLPAMGRSAGSHGASQGQAVSLYPWWLCSSGVYLKFTETGHGATIKCYLPSLAPGHSDMVPDKASQGPGTRNHADSRMKSLRVLLPVVTWLRVSQPRSTPGLHPQFQHPGSAE